MTAQELLDTVPEGTNVSDFTDFVPYDAPNFWQLAAMTPVLASLDKRYRRTTHGWHKLTQAEQKSAKMDELRHKFHVLMTDPQLLQ